MKKITLLLSFLVIILSGCTRDLSKYIDVYFLQGEDGDVLVVDFEKYIKEYPKSNLEDRIGIDGKFYKGNELYSSFNALIKTGFKHLYIINLLKIDKPEELTLELNYLGFYKKSLKDIVDNTKEKYNFALLNNVDIEKRNNELIFSMYSFRIKENKSEYLPNSENFRILIQDEKGKEVYNSSFRKNTLQAISEVLPKNVGNVFGRKEFWNYTNNDGKKVGKGKYKVKMIIPCKPMPYIEEKEIQID